MDDAIKVFNTVIENLQGIQGEIRNNVYKMLEINTESDMVEEYVRECIETFEFNLFEKKFLEHISDIIDNELKKVQMNYYNNADYSSISDNIIQELKNLKKIDISIDNSELLTLSKQIASRFPNMGISIEQFYDHFMSKRETINSMIEKYNEGVLNTLISLSPKLCEKIWESKVKNEKNMSQTATKVEGINANPSSNIGDLIKKIDAKIAELEKEEKHGMESKTGNIIDGKINTERGLTNNTREMVENQSKNMADERLKKASQSYMDSRIARTNTDDYLSSVQGATIRLASDNIGSNISTDKFKNDEQVYRNYKEYDTNNINSVQNVQTTEKENKAQINDFAEKVHNESDINNVLSGINDFVLNKKRQVDSINDVTIFEHITPVQKEDIRRIYAENGFYNVDTAKVESLCNKANEDLCIYMLDHLKSTIVDNISKDRIRNRDRSPISTDTVNFYMLLIKEELPQEIKKDIVDFVLEQCNNKNNINNLFLANSIVKTAENKLGRHLNLSYTLGVANSLNKMTKCREEKQPIGDVLITDANIQTFAKDDNNTKPEEIEIVKNTINDALSFTIAGEMKMDIVFDLTEKINNGIQFVPLDINSIKSYVNINDEYALQLANEVNEMLNNYTTFKAQMKNRQPLILDGSEENILGRKR